MPLDVDKLELDRLLDDADACARAEHVEADRGDLLAQVEGLTAERDHYRVGLGKAQAEVRWLREGIAGLPRHEIYVGATDDDQFDGLYVADADLAALLEVPHE